MKISNDMISSYAVVDLTVSIGCKPGLNRFSLYETFPGG